MAKAIVNGEMSASEAFRALGLSLSDAADLQKVFGDEGSRGIALMLGQSDVLRQYTDQIEDGAKAAEMLAFMQSGIVAKGSMLSNYLESLTIRLGDNLLPAIDSTIDGFNDLLASWEEFAKVHPDASRWVAWGGIAIGALVGVSGAIRFVVWGLRFTYLKAIGTWAATAIASFFSVSTAAKLSSAQVYLGMGVAKAGLVATTFAFIKTTLAAWGLNAALFANPITWIVLGVVALIAGLVLLVVHWDSVKLAAAKSIVWISGALGTLKAVMISVWSWIKRVWEVMTIAIMASPHYKALKALIDMAMYVIAWLSDTGDITVTMQPKPIPAMLPAGSLAPTIPMAQSKLMGQNLAHATGQDSEPALPSGVREPTAAIVNNYFTIKTDGPVDEKKLAREIEKARQEMKLRSVEGVR
jgi:hypothetical protein